MLRALTAAVTALFFLISPGALAQEATEPAIVPCANPDGLEVVTRDGLSSEITTPSFLIGNEFEPKEVLVDLAATSTLATATVDTLLTWDIPANDYDLQVDSARDSATSENYQPFDPAEERVTLAKIAHCEVLTITAIDFLAPAPVDALALELTVSKVVEPVVTPTS